MKNQQLFDVWVATSGSKIEKNKAVERYIINSISRKVSDEELPKLKEKIRFFCKKISDKWEKCSRKKETFILKHSKFLNECVNWIELFKDTAKQQRPLKSFDEICDRSKRRRVQETVTTLEESELMYAAELKLRKSGRRTTAKLVKKITSSSPKTTRIIRKTWPFENRSSIVTLSENEALSLIVEADLSKHQYMILRDVLKTHNINVLPSYQKIIAAKRKCYPAQENIVVTERTAEIKLQGLLDHTIARIVESQEDVLPHFEDDELSSLVLLSKWGFDRSTGHSEYHQTCEDDFVDTDLFVTSMVPLQLYVDNNNKERKIFWQNPRPSSTRYCRPIKFQFKKEDVNLSKEEEDRVISQCVLLIPTELTVNGRNLNITHKMSLTMIDGKVCNALSSTSSAQVCFVCKALPKEMNNIDVVLSKPVDITTFRFGLSPLHAWIRFFEYFLHVSYRLEFKKWQARGADNATMKARKILLQEEFKREMGLIVDKVQPGAGTSNTGNVARRFFYNPSKAASITGIEESLIWRCSVILQTISSGYMINAEAFDVFAVETARLLVNKYPWYYLPASVHKILIHGSKIIQGALLPIGQLSEEAAESRNKDLKNYREHHTRKMSRKITNEDLVNRLLLTSDPLITSIRKLPKRRHQPFPPEVLILLQSPEVAEDIVQSE